MLLKPTARRAAQGRQTIRSQFASITGCSRNGLPPARPPPRDERPAHQKIEMLPETVLLEPGATQQLLVRATFSDGHIEDVTHWAKFNAANAIGHAGG